MAASALSASALQSAAQQSECSPNALSSPTFLTWEFHCAGTVFPDNKVEIRYTLDRLEPSLFPALQTAFVQAVAQTLTDDTPSDMIVTSNDIVVEDVSAEEGFSPGIPAGIPATLVTLNVSSPPGATTVSGQSVMGLIFMSSMRSEQSLNVRLSAAQFGYSALHMESQVFEGRIPECTAGEWDQYDACVASVECDLQRQQLACIPSCLCDSPTLLSSLLADMLGSAGTQQQSSSPQCNTSNTTVDSLPQCEGDRPCSAEQVASPLACHAMSVAESGAPATRPPSVTPWPPATGSLSVLLARAWRSRTKICLATGPARSSTRSANALQVCARRACWLCEARR
eukprot:2756108-Rhodomonas_salina.2